MSKCYLVTGAAGFIGSKVSRLLLDAGHSVVGIDNLNQSYDARLKEWRLAQLTGLAQFQFHRFDITDLPALERLFGKGDKPLDAVLNLGARAGVQPSVVDPWVY